MKLLTKLSLVLPFILPICACAQSVPLVVYAVTVDPPLAAGCSAVGYIEFNTVNGNLWGCPTNTKVWTQIVSVPGSGITSITALSPLTGGTITSAGSIGCNVASGSLAGCLASADWTTFNSKQSSGSYLTALTGDGVASGPGSAAFTLASVLSTPGTFGSSTQCVTLTANAKGLITAISQTACAGGGSSFYQTFEANTTPVTQRAKFNLAAGSNVTVTPTDNGSDTTTFTISSTGGGSSSITTGAGVPSANCTVGSGAFIYFDTALTNPGTAFYFCSATNVWSPWMALGGSGGLTYTAANGVPVIDINTSAVPFKSTANIFTGAITLTGGSTQGSETVSFSATPTFSSLLGNSTITLTANVTSFTLAGAALDGQDKVINFCQNGTGGFTVTPPSNVHGMSIGTTAGKCSSWVGRWNVGQSAWLAIGGVNNQ